MRRVYALVGMGLGLLLVVSGGGVFAGWWGGVEPHWKPRLTSPNPECPVNWGDFVVRTRLPEGGYDRSKLGDTIVPLITAEFDAGSAPSPYGFSLPNKISDVPEFHDCQRMRFVDGDSVQAGAVIRGIAGKKADGNEVRYGPVMGVFAGEKLDSMPDTVFYQPQAVAEVFVPERGQYEPLHIFNTFNCLVVQRLRSGSEWLAWMVPVTREAQCRFRFTKEQLKAPLSLSISVHASPAKSANYVPSVARWDWDSANNKQVIGVRCGNNWCWVGDPAGMEPPPSYPISGATGIAQAMAEIPGYSDRQQLAEWDKAKKLYPGPNWGIVMPTPDLQQALYGGLPGSPNLSLADKLANFTADWVHVANVFIGPSAGSYANTWNYVADAHGPPNGRHARIYLCRGNGRYDCKPRLPYLYIKPVCHGAKSDSVRWYAKIEQDSKPTKYYCVTYCQHLRTQIPAVTRWRWRVDDEGIWISCPEGCCETNSDES